MGTPFEELGLTAGADPEEIRAAYRVRVKICHPDLVQDPGERARAQEKMVRLNRAYEEALRLALPRQRAAYIQEMPAAEAVTLSDRMLTKGRPESALRQLMRADRRDAAWHAAYGRVMMRMEHYPEAHQAFRQAVRLDPGNREYHQGALEAQTAEKRSKTFSGMMRKILRGIKPEK